MIVANRGHDARGSEENEGALLTGHDAKRLPRMSEMALTPVLGEIARRLPGS